AVLLRQRKAELEDYLTLEQVGAALGISTREASRLTRMPGGLPRAEISRKCIRVRRSDLLAFVENRLVHPPSTLYSPSQHDRPRTTTSPQTARTDAGRARRAGGRPRKLAGAMGKGRGRHLRAGRTAGAAPRGSEAGQHQKKET